MSKLRKLSMSVFAGLALHAAAQSGSAQVLPEAFLQPKDGPQVVQPGGEKIAEPKDKSGIKVLEIQTDQTKTIGMTKTPGSTEEPIIEKVQNSNPKIIRVQSIFNDPRRVLITGLAPGTSRVIFTGYTDREMKDRRDEIFEIIVPDDTAQARKEFLELVKRTVPTANVQATVHNISTAGPTVTTVDVNSSNTSAVASQTRGQRWTVFLTGNVLTADNVNTVLETARAVFGPGANLVNNMTMGGVQQVEIDCTICSVNRSKLRTMSFSWALNRPDFYINSILSSNSLTNAISTAPAAVIANQSVTGGGNLAFGAITNSGSFFGFLQALRTDGLAKVQAEPKVVTLSGRPAQFVSGGETPILTQSGNGGPSVSYKTFGVTVTVLPIVLGNGKIHLEVAPLISQLNQANGITIAGANGSTVVPGFDTQGAQVAVQLEDGQTIAIGGLIQHTVNASNSKVPVLGDVPFIGAAFRSVSYTDREQELIILVTPRLVDPMGCDQLPARLPTRLTRTPDDFELYLEGLLELPRGQRQTCGPNGCYQAPHNIGPTAGQFPCGDNGSCGVTGGLRGHGAACGPNGCKTGCSAPTGCAPVPTTTRLNTMPSTLPMAMPTGMPANVQRTMTDPGVAPAMPPAELPASNVAPVGYISMPMDTPAAGPSLRLPQSGNPD